MNVTSSSPLTNFPTASMDKVAMSLYAIEGFFVMVINAFMFVRIMSIRELRNQKEFVTMAGCIMFDVFFGATYFAAGIWRIFIFFNYDYIPAWSQWSCYLSPSVQLFILITPAAGYILILTALDRFLCIFYPIRYIKFSVKYSYFIMFAPYIADIPTHILSFFDSFSASTDRNKTMMCMMYMGISVSLYTAMRSIRILCSLFAVLIYVPVAGKMFMLVQKQQQNIGISTRSQKKLVRLTGTIALITVNTLVLFTVPDIITYFDPTITTFVFYIMNLNKGVVNIIALLATQRSLRRLFTTRNSQVAVSSVAPRTVSVAPSARLFVPTTNKILALNTMKLKN